MAVNVHEWRVRQTPKWTELTERNILTATEAEDMMHAAVCSMARLNRHGGALMVPHNAHAGTDVTGFGILGHAQNLMENQAAPVGMEIHTLPCIANTAKVEHSGVFNFGLLRGYSAETSGGLMICMPEADAAAYCRELETLDGEQAWVVGKVVADSNRRARLLPDLTILEVELRC